MSGPYIIQVGERPSPFQPGERLQAWVGDGHIVQHPALAVAFGNLAEADAVAARFDLAEMQDAGGLYLQRLDTLTIMACATPAGLMAHLSAPPARRRKNQQGWMRAVCSPDILGTHPHPDPADRDPRARAALYAGRLSGGYRERKTAMERAQAEALAAMTARSVGTRLLASIGISTPEERHAQDRVAYALALTADAEARQPTPANYKEARADGAAHAYTAQSDTTAWERRPDVAQALELDWLNQAVDAAAQVGDPAISLALRVGDPEAARQVIRGREEEEERRLGRQGGLDGLTALEAGSPGPRGPK